jgi:hypothetical protein
MDLQTRVVNILTRPQTEWTVIASEPTDVATLYKSYIMMLAAIPPAAGYIGMTLFGISVPVMGTVRVGVVQGLTAAVVQYVLSLVGVYIASIVIDKLAPTFQSQPDAMQALKLVAYASTPSWLAGALGIIPALSPLAILGGLYGIYLFYLGVAPLMKTPSDKVVPYMAVSALAIIVVMVVTTALAAAMGGVMR